MAGGKGSTGRATILVFILTLVSNILGLGRESYIAYAFGATGWTDAYYVASIIPDIASAWISLTLTNALIPVLKRELDRSPESAKDLARLVFLYIAIILGLMTVLIWLFRYQVISLLAPGLSEHVDTEAVRLLNLMVVSVIFTGLSGVLWGIHNAYESFGYPALMGVIYNVLLLGTSVIFNHSLHIFGLALGFSVGVIGRLVVQLIPLLKTLWKVAPYRRKGASRFYHPRIKDVMFAAPAIFFSIGVGIINQIVDRILASGLPVGQLTDLNFATKIGTLPYTLFGLALATTLYTRFVSARDRTDTSELQGLLKTAGSWVLFIGLIITSLFVEYNNLIVKVLFDHGAFSAHDGRLVSNGIQIYGLFTVFYLAVPVLTHFFFAGQENRVVLRASSWAVAVNISVSVILVRIIGIYGLVLANGIAYGVNFAILMRLALKRVSSNSINMLIKPLKDSSAPCVAFIASASLLQFSLGRPQSLSMELFDSSLAVLAGIIAVLITGLVWRGNPLTARVWRMLLSVVRRVGIVKIVK